MKVKTDQSGKVEKTNKNTILAFSNNIQRAICIPAKVKRQLKERFRKQGRIRVFVYRTFAAGIVLLIQEHIEEIDVIIIDIEYIGKEEMIEEMIQEMLKKLQLKEPQIRFEHIGKKAKAHYIAYGTAIKKRKPDRIVTFKEISNLVFGK